jgi:hypothetical protein
MPVQVEAEYRQMFMAFLFLFAAMSSTLCFVLTSIASQLSLFKILR